VHRIRGLRHGAITRLVSPSDLGQVLKPFVFLDLFDMEKASFPGTGLHPHSGIVTVTYLFEGSIRYEDTTGATGVLPAGGVECMDADIAEVIPDFTPQKLGQQPTGVLPGAIDPDLAERLWRLSEKMTGVKFSA
jgi:redox-sensitive bicupin YhaK (pirin superfamily)